MSSVVPHESTAPSANSSSVWRGLSGAASAVSVTLPHAFGLSLLALSPLNSFFPIGAIALWAVAIPCLVMAIAFRRSGVVYAPSTVISLLYTSTLAIVVRNADSLGLTPANALAITASVVAFAFLLQWLMGILRLTDLARFMPVSVVQGFAAGVGLAMVFSQFKIAFGAELWAWDVTLAMHLAVAGSVVLLAWLMRTLVSVRWPQFPWLFASIVAVALPIMLLTSSAGDTLALLTRATEPFGPTLIVLPSWEQLPWKSVIFTLGPSLLSIAALAALVNSLEITVFRQELAAQKAQPEAIRSRAESESLMCIALALTGCIPASTSASRTRMASQNGVLERHSGLWHGLLVFAVALTGAMWLHLMPVACFAGALVIAGARQIPASMLSKSAWRRRKDAFVQSWLVALVFALAGGVVALVTGLVVATVALLKLSASSALRREHLSGQLRSRRLRRSEADVWIAERMNQVAVFELQGIVSFGVAAVIAKQIRAKLLSRHRWVILDATRVPGWDETGLTHLRNLSNELALKGISVALAVNEGDKLPTTPDAEVFSDLDRALEWAEEGLLAERPATAAQDLSLLGELGQFLSEQARQDLLQRMNSLEVEAGASLFCLGDQSTDLYFVQQGRISMETERQGGLRLATVGRGQAFGEMAFLNGTPRTAYALVKEQSASLLVLTKPQFDAWASSYPSDALSFMSCLAQVSNRRLALTTRQLRAVLE
jgi:sulfate permease, SulP family